MRVSLFFAASAVAAATACGTGPTFPGTDAGSPLDIDAGPGTADGGDIYPHPAGWATVGGGSFHGDTAKRGLTVCTRCHGDDLTGDTAPVSCNECHESWRTNCTFCHGGKDNRSGAPPDDVTGRTDTAEVTVGAHTSHFGVPHKLSKPLACGACHPMHADALEPGHGVSGPAKVTVAGWDRSTASCSSVYCHGNFKGGNRANAPVWTKVDQGQAQCGTCHTIPPADGPSRPGKTHHSWKDCSECHGAGYSTSRVNQSTHMNNSVDIVVGLGWNSVNRSCTTSCHTKPQTWQ